MKDIINKITMFQMAVVNMDESKKFYTDKLGFEVSKDIKKHGKQYVLLVPSEGGPSIILTTSNVNVKPGSMKIYLSTPNIEETYDGMKSNGIEMTSDIIADSGGTYFSFDDPDGNTWVVVLCGYGDVPPVVFY
jgi:predicted enzyme related to lactoylglutathione lyase